MMTFVDVIIFCVIFLAGAVLFAYLMRDNAKTLSDIVDKLDKLQQEKEKPKEVITPPILLTYEEVEKIINDRIDEIWRNKYLLYFTIRELKMIPNMDDEIENFVSEVHESFSENLYYSIYTYYTREYLTKMITRQAQILMVDYINTHKPIIK